MVKIQLPNSLTRVTGFSKALAVLIIFIFMMFSFYLGIQYQKKAANLGLGGTAIPTSTQLPTPTSGQIPTSSVSPVQSSQYTCQTDTDCVLASADSTVTTTFCCPNTKCLDLSASDVKAVNGKWLEEKKQSACTGRMCPMIAAICTRQIQESNNHYVAKCIKNTCQKVYQ